VGEADPEIVIATLQANEAKVRTLRARFDAKIAAPQGTRSVGGVLVIAKPDRVRFRLMLPFGVTVYDFVKVGGEAWQTQPLGGRSVGIDPYTLSDVFLRDESVDRVGCMMGSTAEWVATECHGRLERIRRSDATVESAAIGDRNGVVITYADERLVDGVPLPFTIVIHFWDDVVVTVSVDRYEVNPQLADDIFQPPPDAEAMTLR
jgi:hypothetical protein